MKRKSFALIIFALLPIKALVGTTAINSNTVRVSATWQALLSSFKMNHLAARQCPAGVPFAHCYFIAANGSDSNSGQYKTDPWLHVPGMPSCASLCAAEQKALGDASPNNGGLGFILRGGDTWHFGNPAASPHTGGTWSWNWSGNWNPATNCDTSDIAAAVRSGCVYVGVDKTWYAGAAWSRPIMTGDNPTSTTPVASCTFPKVGSANQFLLVRNYRFAWFDNFEWTGMCNDSRKSVGNQLGTWNLYIDDLGLGPVPLQNIYSNMYAHGWTHLPFSCAAVNGQSVGMCESDSFIDSQTSSASTLEKSVCDGWDSDPSGVICMFAGPAYLVYDNVFANQAQMVANGCHIWHDNRWFGYTHSGDGVAHGNQWECNSSAPSRDSDGNPQPAGFANLYYNNIQAHTTAISDGILWQICANNTYNWYVFNNLTYDEVPGGQYLNWGGSGCPINASGGSGTTGTVQVAFNNTWDLPQPATLKCFTTVTYTNNLIVVDGGDGFSAQYAPCLKAATNRQISHAAAVSQRYMSKATGHDGMNRGTTCADDATPCASTLISNPTVGTGTNVQSYCDTLLAANNASIRLAGAACKNGTTYSCVYDLTSRSVICPSIAPAARPASAPWDVGAHQFAAGGR